jgi:hypothetical protein
MHSLNSQEFSSLRQRLSLHFTDKLVAEVLGANSMCEWFVTRKDKPVNIPTDREDSTTVSLTNLWVLGEAVPEQLVQHALGDLAKCLSNAGWLIPSDEECMQSSLSILPCDGLWLVTDHMRNQDQSDSVFFPDSSSVNSFCCFPRSDGPHLDVGTGCGLTALAAARNGQEVEINDVNARALTLTQIGFKLNGFTSPRIHEGDFARVDGRFNSIAFNLPVPSDAGMSPTEPVHSRSPRSDLLEKMFDWLPAHLALGGLVVVHTRFPDDILGFGRSLETICSSLGWRGLAVHAPNNGTGFFGVLVLQREGSAGFKSIEFDPNDTVWRTHWEWPAILDLLRAKPVSDSLSLTSHLELVPWVRPLARMSIAPDGKWGVETVKLFRVELSGADAQAFRLLAEGRSLEETIEYVSGRFSLTRDQAEGSVNQLATRLLSAGLATLRTE